VEQFVNGHIYHGYFKDGRIHGFLVIKGTDKMIFEGVL
jgi:hypothetical protein